MVDSGLFKPLQRQAREEIARQINTVEPDAQKLVASGFGWSLALEISRQILGGGNPSVLQSFGMSAQVARAIGVACDEAIAARTPVEAEPMRTARFRGDARAAPPAPFRRPGSW